MRRQRLIDAKTLSPIPCSVRAFTSTLSDVNLALVEPSSNKFRKILHQHPELFRPTFSTSEVKHGIQHFIPTQGRPVFARLCRLAPNKLLAAKKEFLEMEKMGIIRKSKRPWSSPLHIVHKLDGNLRLCGDFRSLNDATVPDHYPVPHIQDFSARLNGKTIFSKIDLISGYHQIPVAPEDVPKTAVITPFIYLEAIPIPVDTVQDIKESFMSCAESESIELAEIPKHSDLKQIVPEGAPYFYVELPTGEKCLHRIGKHFPLQFGREAVCEPAILNCPERVDWKTCKLSKEDETELSASFKKEFREFDFNFK